MMQLHLPWLELSILIPVAGAIWVSRIRNAETAQRVSVAIMGLVLIGTVGAWLDFCSLHTREARDWGDILTRAFGPDFPIIDEFSAPLLPLTALLYLLTAVATLRTKVRRFSFAGTLASLALLLAMLSCKEPWILIGLLAGSTAHPYLELRARGRPTRVFATHMLLMICLLVVGWAIITMEGIDRPHSLWAVTPLLLAVFIRCGIAPLHCWMTDLFEHATFGTALLFATPMIGAYAAVRLVLPVAPDWELHSIGLLSLLAAVYAAGMALIQREARRFFCYLLLSHSALVLVGLEIATPNSFTGALCVWMSISLALTGFGLTLRSIEARTGRLSLATYHGLYEHTPMLAGFFLLTGLASVGFPGTFGFIGTEMLVEGAVTAYPYVGVAVVAAAALNGIAVVKAYFLIFTGTRHVASISLRCRVVERIAVFSLAALILGGGFYPQPGVASRHHAAVELIRQRDQSLAASEANADSSRQVGQAR